MTKMLCIVIDGLLPEALECAHVCSLRQLMLSGTTMNHLYHQGPNLPLPGLATLFSSIGPEEHGVVNNNQGLIDSRHATSLFSLLRYHHLSSALFHSREHLQHLVPYGELHASMYINSQGIQNNDSKVAALAGTYIQAHQPDLCCLCLQGVDITGTHFGYLSEPYLESIEQADQAIGLLLEQLRLVGLHNDYTIMVTAGYGGSWTQSTGHRSPIFLPWIISGQGICHHLVIEAEASFLHVAPTMAAILDIAPHPSWKGSVLENIFLHSLHPTPALAEEQQYMHLLNEHCIRPAA